MENPKMKIMALKARYVADRVREMTNDKIEAEGTPLADDFYMDAVESAILLALYELET